MTGDGGDLENIGVLGVNGIFARRFQDLGHDRAVYFTYH